MWKNEEEVQNEEEEFENNRKNQFQIEYIGVCSKLNCYVKRKKKCEIWMYLVLVGLRIFLSVRAYILMTVEI